MTFIDLIKAFIAGGLATAAMDLVAIKSMRKGLFQLGGLQIVPVYLGRWFFHLQTYHPFAQQDIRHCPPRPQEAQIGMRLHYLIGAILGIGFWLLLVFWPLQGIAIGLTGLAYGLLTNAFPWIWMYPSMGFGFFGSKLSVQADLLKFSCLNHLVYGAALGAATWFLKALPS